MLVGAYYANVACISYTDQRTNWCNCETMSENKDSFKFILKKSPNRKTLTIKLRTAKSGSVGEKKCSIAEWAWSWTFLNTAWRDSLQWSSTFSSDSSNPFTVTHSIIRPFTIIAAFNTRATFTWTIALVAKLQCIRRLILGKLIELINWWMCLKSNVCRIKMINNLITPLTVM